MGVTPLSQEGKVKLLLGILSAVIVSACIMATIVGAGLYSLIMYLATQVGWEAIRSIANLGVIVLVCGIVLFVTTQH